MKSTFALAVVLLAGMQGAAVAQILVPAQQPIIVGPVSQNVMPSDTVIVTQTQPVTVSRVYVPQGVLQTDVNQPAPFNPAPVGTVIATTAGTRTVQSISGYDVVMDESGKNMTNHALLADGLGDGTYSRAAVENFWPLQVGRSETYNLNTSQGGRAVTLKVLRTELIAVPAGTFFTYVIERRDRMTQDGTENATTSWYAPSVGTIVKFEEEVGRPTKPRTSYEAVSIRLPQALTGATVISAVRRADTVDMQSQFCRERGSALRLADGRILVLDCPTYVQVDRLAYESWLLVQ